MTITEKQLAEKVTAVYHEGSDLEAIMQNIARKAAELLGVELAPEPIPLPTEPGSVIIATEVRGETGEWRMLLDDDGEWSGPESIGGWGHHCPEHITAWAEARVVPVTAVPVTLTEGQVGELWNANKVPHQNRWTATLGSLRGSVTATVNAALAQHAAPAEGEPISVDDVQEGDRVRVVLDNGDEATFTVTHVGRASLESHRNVYPERCITAAYLLNREEEA